MKCHVFDIFDEYCKVIWSYLCEMSEKGKRRPAAKTPLAPLLTTQIKILRGEQGHSWKLYFEIEKIKKNMSNILSWDLHDFFTSNIISRKKPGWVPGSILDFSPGRKNPGFGNPGRKFPGRFARLVAEALSFYLRVRFQDPFLALWTSGLAIF